MNTERNERQGGWILYDGECPACKGMAARFEGWARRRGYEPIPLQTPWVKERLNMDGEMLLAEMRVLTKEGRLCGGVDALGHLARQTIWGRPVAWLIGTTMGRAGLDVLYKAFAARRYCLGGTCRIKQDFPRRRRDQALFAAAGLYNLLWAGKTIIDPAWFPRWAGMPGNDLFFRALGWVVLIFGLAYILLSVQPEKHIWMAAVGLLGKLIGPVAQTLLVLVGPWTAKTLWWTIPNDILWWVPFSFYLRDAWKLTPATHQEVLP